MVPVVREFVRTRDPLIHDPLNTYTQQPQKLLLSYIIML